MSYPPGPYEGTPGWQGQQPGWQPPQQPGWQGQPPGWQGQQPGWPSQLPPDNYLVWAILTTLFCCLPTGIVSIVYSTKVSGLWAQGQYGEAQAAANNAKKWAIISAVAGPIAYVLLMVIYFAFIAAMVVHELPSIPTTTTPTYPGF
jgi:hypothetical protein